MKYFGLLLLALCGCQSCDSIAVTCENSTPYNGRCWYPQELVVKAGAAICQCPGKSVRVEP